ncbi:hypothetical protein K435DRAFT_968021 [Dendrothele bispora CBS 962.96]|uniref:SEC7 domain-containing protein n=1 Tax=Dendrothele bispora (strain CBS 962.96) TaxID=1314807 RepID=A0A4S8LQX3_DENBC|nr:hypothetical protein K435DRAFT_968021 [Dendrothele bispora CBS 962.96]
MVGQGSRHHGKHLFSRTPSTDTSPPSYNQDDPSPVLFSETTVTTTEVVTTTTQTTTHFFSLPLWRKRPATAPSEPPSSPPQNSMIANQSTPPRFSNFRLEKELPPTPPHDSSSTSPFASVANSQRTSLDEIVKETALPSLFPPTDYFQSPRNGPHSASSSTAVLAHAALGLGLPHVLSHAASASHPELNTVAFIDSPSTSFDSPPSRRPSTRAFSAAGKPGDVSKPANRRRTRGLSLGPASFLNFGSPDSKGKGKGKGKEKEVQAEQTPEPSRLIRRKSSFWSRRKSLVDDTETPSKPELLPPLPALPPVSPFGKDMPLSSSPTSELGPQHSRGLSRSHSERLRSQSPTFVMDSDGSSSRPQRRPRRPATADSSARGDKSPRLLLSDDQRLTSSPTTEQPSSPQRLRARAATNPPFLHRLSMNLFMSSSVSNPSSPVLPGSPSRTALSKNTPSIPKALVDEESPEGYLNRLMDSVSKAEIAAILASSNDSFHVQALRSYIGRFDFAHDSLDVALRRLLMDVGLPRETQQIDRVMEAFASRYFQSHPKLFTSEDHPYILAFSLIMLHTDAFNKSNKRKMTKQDYIKNTRLPGVAPEVLDCFYDNIVFAPFIFIEDPLDVNGQRGYVDGSPRKSTAPMTVGNSISSSSSMILGKGNKVDLYYLISNNMLDHLRVNVELYVPLTNPYSYEGTAGPWDEEELQASFAGANVITVEGADLSRPPSSFFGLGPGMGPASPLVTTSSGPSLSTSEVWNLRVTKIGLLNRKDEALEGGRKAGNRKWRMWNVILTGSQLLFFRDTSNSWANISSESSDEHIVLPQATMFKPDELYSVKDAIAVYDRFYTKHEHAFRFFMRDGRQFLLASSDEEQMNQWMSRINYASAFKSTGVRMRPVGMSGRDLQLTGVAAATSHLHDLQHMNSPRGKHRDGDHVQNVPNGRERPSGHPRRSATLMSEDVDPDVPVAPEVDGADQFKATFDQVKADLAAGRCASPDNSGQHDFVIVDNGRLPSRARVVLSKVREMDSKISAAQTQLETDIRFVRNIATLTPFQRSTRERLLLAVQGVSRRVMLGRLEILRLTCHRDVLLNDLAAEGQVWNRAKKMALKAATETLQSQQVPRMTLSFHESQSVASPPVPIPQKSPTSPTLPQPESTAGSVQSFHSALDFVPDWPTDEVSTSNYLETSRTHESPRNSSTGSLQAPGDKLQQDNLDGLSPRTSEEQPSHQKFYTAQEGPEEQAEEWDKTRVVSGRPRARVSLVRVPSTIGLASRFEKLG